MNPLLLIDSEDTPVLRLDLSPTAGNNARELFLKGAENFSKGVDEIVTFDPGYQLQEGECFQIKGFSLNEDLLSACRQPLSAERLDSGKLADTAIKSIIGYDFSNGQKKLFFQNFDSRRVLVPGKRFAVFATADSSTFKELEAPVVLLDAQIAVIWDDGVLKFKSFELAKRIFDLSDYFTEATDEQIGGFATHKLIACEDQDKLIKNCTAWSRKKISLIMRSGTLDGMSIEAVREAGATVEYEVPTDGSKIALPTDRQQLKALLQFLDEDIYRGAISQRRLLSSGKRQL